MSSGDLAHDQINLGRLLRRLEKTNASEFSLPSNDSPESFKAWTRARSNLQVVKYARKLLETLESANIHVKAVPDAHATIDRMQAMFESAATRLEPQLKVPPPILPTLPVPQPRLIQSPSPTEAPVEPTPEAVLIPAEPVARPADLLLPSPTPSPAATPTAPAPSLSKQSSSSLNISRPATSTSPSASSRGLMPGSNALQNDLSEQLAQMAQQLKRNAEHFADSLAKDRAVVEGAGEKLEGNYGVMQTTRTRLKAHSAKSSGTTWTVVLAVIVAAAAFVLTFLIIRIT